MRRFRCPPPSNEEDFELLCLHLLRKARECSDLKRNGRRGYRQYGVDQFGETSKQVIGVQCKLTSTRPITQQQVVSEIEKAEGFEPPLGHYIIATTGPRDPQLQRFVLDRSLAHQARGGFSVELLFWHDLEEDLQFHTDVRDSLYGGLSSEQAEALLSSVGELNDAVEANAGDHRQLAEKLLQEFKQQQQAFHEHAVLTREELSSLRDALLSALDRVSQTERDEGGLSTADSIRELGVTGKLLETLLAERAKARAEVGALDREIASVAYVTGEMQVAEDALRAILAESPSDVAALNQLGRICGDQGRWEEAEALFRRVIDFGVKQVDTFTQAAGYSNLGTMYRSQRRFNHAESNFRLALRLHKAIGEREEVANILAKIGSLFHLRGDYRQARKYYRRALKIARTVSPSAERLPLHYLANLYESVGNPERSERIFRRLLSVAEPTNIGELAMLFGNLGNTLAAQSKLSEAEAAMRKAYEYDSRLGNTEGIARNLCNRAMLHYHRMEFDAAEMSLTEALDYANRLGDNHLAAVALGNLAEVLLEKARIGTEDFARVENIARQGLALAEQMGSADSIARKQVTLGRIYLTLGMKVEAKQFFETAREAFTRMGLTHMVQMANEMLDYC
jgi:tetratricopeptide (TPR) repeat protein